MKRSSVIILIVIFVVFAATQGAVIYGKLRSSASVTATSAFVTGETLMVGTPVSGIVRAVYVTEGQRVDKGQPLFMVYQQSPLDPHGGTPMIIVAQRAGNVYGITAVVDSFVQASQILGRIVDTGPGGLYVQATLSVSPGRLPEIVQAMPAVIRAAFLDDGKDIPAVVTSIDLYDGVHKTVDVRLRMLTQPAFKDAATVVGLPVEVRVVTEKKAQEVAVKLKMDN